MAKTQQEEVEKIYIDKFPKYDPSAAQIALHSMAADSDETFIFWSRQVGKSNGCSWIFWDKLINNSYNGELYVVLSPSESEIYEFLVNDILIEAFGGKGVVYDINAVYIPAPKKWLKIMGRFWAETPGAFEQWLLKGWITEDRKWVRLFRESLSITGKDSTGVGGGKKKQQHYEGKLFTGASILLVACTHHLDNILRGRKISGVYGEEVGQWPKNPFGVIMPSLLRQGGWLMVAGTPNGTDPHNWVYTEFVKPIRNSPYHKHVQKAGVDWYKNVTEKEATLKMEDVKRGLMPEEKNGKIVTRTQILSIGDIEKVFPYVYEGTQVFDEVQMSRRFPHKVVPKRDPYGQVIIDEDNRLEVKSDEGTRVFEYYKYDVVPIEGQQNRPGATLTEDKYNREYRMDFNAGSGIIFYNWNRDINVIPQEDFNPDLYNSIAGYDHGIWRKQVQDTKEERRASASAWAKVAVVPHGNEFQYVVWDCGYIDEPTASNIADIWHNDLLLNGIPIVAENALWKTGILEGGKAIGEIINANDALKADYRGRPGVGIFKCRKRTENDKFNDINVWLMQQSIKSPMSSTTGHFRHPSSPSKLGRKLMVTSNCVEFISLLEDWSYQVTAEGYKKPKTVRNDIFDTVTYPIDYFEKFPENRQKIQSYWMNHPTWSRHDKPSEGRAMSAMEVLAYQQRKRRRSFY